MRTFIYKYLFLSVCCVLVSCDNFDEINTNPDVPTSVSPDMLATQVLKNTYRFWNPNPVDFSTANLWCKHIAITETNPNPYQYYYAYWPFGGFGGFKNLTDLKRMTEFAEGSITESSFKGLALFLKAYYGYNSTLELGDIPYSEAGKAEDGIVQPKYDKQEDVFKYILADLKEAETLFASGKNFGGDIMYGGDVAKWRKLCAAMQLKVIQTISKKATAEQKVRFAEIFAANNLMTSNTDIFQLVYNTLPGQSHPFWNGEDRRNYVAISKLMVDNLKKYKDRRLFYFAEPAKSLITSGKLETDFDAYQGANTAMSADSLAINGQAGKYSMVNKRYADKKEGDPMILFSYGEQCFIIAEAIEEGWISGDAKAYYEKGVVAMLEYFMKLLSTSTGVHDMAITESYIKGYFSGEAAYKVSGSKKERLEQILTQRYFIDFFQGNGLNYKNFLRTGYPSFPLDPATSLNPDDKTVYPKRWKYPTDEQVTNPINYKKAIDEQYGGYDGINQVPWWLK